MTHIAIVGLGGAFPGASTPAEYWDLIARGADVSTSLPNQRTIIPIQEAYQPGEPSPDKVTGINGCFVDHNALKFDYDFLGVPKSMVEPLDPSFKVGLYAAQEAFKDAEMDKVDRSRVGVIIGNIVLPTDHTSKLTRDYLGAMLHGQAVGNSNAKPTGKVGPFDMHPAGLPAAMIAAGLDISGGSYTLDAACASSLFAIKFACDELKAGRVDAMISGGISRPDCLYTQMGFAQLRALSAKGKATPFDHRADGLVVGEGAGMFVLKRLDDALAHGDTIYGVIEGVGLSNDMDGSLLAPSSEGQLRAMHKAYEQAELKPQDIDIYECHATGTPLGDFVEFQSLSQLWEDADKDKQAVIGSVKGTVGHLLTAAGSASLMKVLLALKANQIPPTSNWEKGQDKMQLDQSPFRVVTKPETWEARDGQRRAAVSAFGFGGTNAHLIVRQYQPEEKPAPVTPPKKAERIAIVGMAIKLGNAADVQDYVFKAIGGQANEDTQAAFGWDAASIDALPNGHFIKEVAMPLGRFRIPPLELKEMIPQQLLMLLVAEEAIKDSGMVVEKENPKVGSFVGLGLDLNTTNYQLRWDLYRQVRTWNATLGLNLKDADLDAWAEKLREAAGPALNSNRVLAGLGGIVGTRVSREFRFGGVSTSISSDEGSGLRAMEQAVRALQNHDLDHAIVGAIDMLGDPRMLKHGAYTFNKDGKTKTFDKHADGATPNEGAVALVLKRLSEAEEAEDRIYAIIDGFGNSNFHFPGRRAGLKLAMERALVEAGAEPHQVGLISSQGTAVRTDDRLEIDASHDVYGKTAIFTAASHFAGHTGAASGLVNLAHTALCLHQRMIPGMSNIKTPQFEDLTGINLPRISRHWSWDRHKGDRRRAAVTAIGTGTASHVILSEHEPSLPSRLVIPLPKQSLFPVHSTDIQGLADALVTFSKWLQPNKDLSAMELAKLWWEEHGHKHDKRTIVLLGDNVATLTENAAIATKALRSHGDQAADDPAFNQLLKSENIAFSATPLGADAPVGYVFPGSGNHFHGMGRELALHFTDVFLEQDRFTEYLAAISNHHLFWGHKSPEGLSLKHRELLSAQVSLNIAMRILVGRFGISPSAVLGYSLGESSSMFATGAWRDHDGMHLRTKESPLFNDQLAGNFTAVREHWGLKEDESVDWFVGVIVCDAEKVRELLKDENRVYCLIVNTPGECVIGGNRDAVQAFVKKLGSKFYPISGIISVHCEAAKPVEEAYRKHHIFETFPPEDIRFYSGARGEAYELNQESAAQSIVDQAILGVDWPKTVRSAHADGIRAFIELGPGASCTRYINEILSDKPHVAGSACANASKTHERLQRLLAKLLANGLQIDLEYLFSKIPVKDESKVRSITIPATAPAFQVPQRPAAVLPPAPPAQPVVPKPPIAAKAPQQPVAPKPAAAPQPSAPARPVAAPRATAPAAVATKPAVQATPAARQAVPQPQPVTRTQPMTTAMPQTQAPAPAAPAAHDAAASLVQSQANALAAQANAHSSYLNFAKQSQDALAQAIAQQTAILHAMGQQGVQTFQAPAAPAAPLAQAPASVQAPPPAAPQQPVQAQAPAAPQPTPTPAAPAPVAQPSGPNYEERDADGKLVPQHRKIPLQTNPNAPKPLRKSPTGKEPMFDREACLEYARGTIAGMLGEKFAEIDTYPTRTRLPDEPLMLVDRIMDAGGVEMSHGYCVTEHDVLHDGWYLDNGHMCTCITIESGQADLWLGSYLGVDFKTEGKSMYRLLDAKVTFHRELPRPGEVISYDIKIDGFFRQGNTRFFRFNFVGSIDGQPLLTMREGIAGFFSNEELNAGKGIIRREKDLSTAKRPEDWINFTTPASGIETYDRNAIDALRRGDYAACFGSEFANLPIQKPLALPSGLLNLVDRITHLEADGGEYGMGVIKAQMEVKPNDWFLTCHFIEDEVMPGTLMYECCLHTLRLFLMRMGWVGEADEVSCHPVLGVASKLLCRGQVLENTKTVTYEVHIRELGYEPEPYVIADAYMYSDAKCIVDISDMCIRYKGASKAMFQKIWAGRTPQPKAVAATAASTPAPAPQTGLTMDYDQILALADGLPSVFGDRFAKFDQGAIVARFPRPPFLFMHRVTECTAKPWVFESNVTASVQYDIPTDAWYFAADNQPVMPYAVLLEIALQSCGWMAAYMGCALLSEDRLLFRNLGGNGTQHLPVTAEMGTLTTNVKVTKTSKTRDVILIFYTFEVMSEMGLVYEGDTYFGFFTEPAMADQAGVTDHNWYGPTEKELSQGNPYPVPTNAPYPSTKMRMMDTVELINKDGGAYGLGYIEGSLKVDPSLWFFEAHFKQDPVWPGSLGLEAFQQLLKVFAGTYFELDEDTVFQSPHFNKRHTWIYRGQVVPTNKKVNVQASIKMIDEETRTIIADGYLMVDGLVIYQIKDFGITCM